MHAFGWLGFLLRTSWVNRAGGFVGPLALDRGHRTPQRFVDGGRLLASAG